MTASDPLTEPFDAWLDRRAAGRSTPAAGAPTDSDFASLRSFAGQLHDLAGQEAPQLLADSPPPSWEDIMNATGGSPSHSPTAAVEHLTPVAPSLRGVFQEQPMPTKSRAMRTIQRWQAAASLALVVAFLIGLVGITWQRGVWDDSSSTPSYGVASPTTASGVRACAPNSTRHLPTENELRAQSIDDWPGFSYVIAQPVSADIGQQVSETYLNYLACAFESAFETPAPTSMSANQLSYLSDRRRFLTLYDTLSPAQQTEIDNQFAFNPVRRIVEDFPLPVNRNEQNIAEFEGGVFATDFFVAQDVYLLPDGRYGAIIGSVSTRMIRTGEPIRDTDGWLTFVAFVQGGDAFYLDESIAICPAAFAPGATGRDSPLDTQPYNPDYLLNGDGYGCT